MGSTRFARVPDTAGPAAKFFSLQRLILICVITLAIIVVSSAGLIIYNLRDRVIAENEAALTNSALIIAKQIEQTFTGMEVLQREFAEDISRASGINKATFDSQLSRYDFHLKLRDKIAGIPYVGALIIYNADGKLINYSRPWPVPDINIADRDYFIAAKADQSARPVLSAPVRNRATGSWVMNLVRKINSPSGEFLGIVATAFELQYLQNYLSAISSDPDSSFAMFRSDGSLLARYPQNDIDIGRRWPNAVSLKLTAEADHGVGMSAGVIDGVIRMVAARRVNNFPIVVTATKTAEALFSGWRRSSFYIAGASAVIIVLINAFSLLFKHLLRNYQALLQARAERNRAEALRQQSLRFDVALNNMSQGLVMFDCIVKPGRVQFPVFGNLRRIARRRKTRSVPARPAQAPQGMRLVQRRPGRISRQAARPDLEAQAQQTECGDPCRPYHPDRQSTYAGRRMGRNARRYYGQGAGGERHPQAGRAAQCSAGKYFPGRLHVRRVEAADHLQQDNTPTSTK